ncbi:hypothetical protein C1H76_3716 [Elsinoe australis]|uniref:Uncharacterized protein n=1 Tax=Elsinoe australis TaxID=40998 RepID=A0A4U7B922_9PEZI|nr:hypothetical protein C1H76_3716 [Elsinoe australis]
MNQNDRIEPESHAAKSFGDDLDSLFGMDKPLVELSQKVEEKKQNVDKQAEELAAIENRLKEAEARLAKATGTSKLPPTPAKNNESANHYAQAQNGASDARPVAPPKDARANFSRPQPPQAYQNATRGQETVDRKPLNPRQDSLGLPPIPGAMPVTPSGMDYRGDGYMQSGAQR